MRARGQPLAPEAARTLGLDGPEGGEGAPPSGGPARGLAAAVPAPSGVRGPSLGLGTCSFADGFCSAQPGCEITQPGNPATCRRTFSEFLIFQELNKL